MNRVIGRSGDRVILMNQCLISNKLTPMRLCVLVVAVSSLWSQAVHGQADAIATLNSKLSGKILTIRNFYSGASLSYTPTGQLVRGGPPGVWTLDGEFTFRKATVKKNRLRLEGERLGIAFQEHSLRQQLYKIEPANIEIDFDHPPDSSEVNSAVDAIFISGADTLADSVPDYWRPLLKGESKPQPLSSAKKVSGSVPPAPVTDPGCSAHRGTQQGIGQANVYRVGADVTAPKGISTPDPEYTEVARRAKFEGTLAFCIVVTPEGEVSDLWLVSPLGLGLDDQAAESLRHWRFQPALKNGKPVAIEAEVEVSFRLWAR